MVMLICWLPESILDAATSFHLPLQGSFLRESCFSGAHTTAKAAFAGRELTSDTSFIFDYVFKANYLILF
jgi:hypothetical protein